MAPKKQAPFLNKKVRHRLGKDGGAVEIDAVLRDPFLPRPSSSRSPIIKRVKVGECLKVLCEKDGEEFYCSYDPIDCPLGCGGKLFESSVEKAGSLLPPKSSSFNCSLCYEERSHDMYSLYLCDKICSRNVSIGHFKMQLIVCALCYHDSVKKKILDEEKKGKLKKVSANTSTIFEPNSAASSSTPKVAEPEKTPESSHKLEADEHFSPAPLDRSPVLSSADSDENGNIYTRGQGTSGKCNI